MHGLQRVLMCVREEFGDFVEDVLFFDDDRVQSSGVRDIQNGSLMQSKRL